MMFNDGQSPKWEVLIFCDFFTKNVGMRGHDVGGRDGREKREYALYYDYVLSCNYDTGVTGV